jgi:hypothetical protein
VVDQNAPHGLRSDGEEMAPALPSHAVLADQAQVRLVHKRSGLQGMAGPLPA